MLAACAAPPPRPATTATVDAFEPTARPGTTIFRVDPKTSEIRALVYRAGALAHLGHNHVIAWRPSRGWVASAAAIQDSSLRLEFTVEQAVIDDTAMRVQEGADFPGEIDDGAKGGTRHNMLSEALLDGDHFPRVSVRSLGMTASPAALSVRLRFAVAGRDSDLVVPVRLDRTSGGIVASGEINLRQSELGLQPFSIMLGALQVQDQMRIKFHIEAR